MKNSPNNAVPSNPRGGFDSNTTPRLKPLAAHVRRALFPGLIVGLQASVALAGPQGGTVVGGSGSIARPNAATTVIQQNSANLAVDWQKFNVKSHELVQFKQPGRKAQALNRIFDQNASQIHGQLKANGRVLLMNPNGVIFGRTARVNVNSLVAAGMRNIPVDDFMAGKFKLEALTDADGMVINEGLIEAGPGGDVTLVGKSIRNEGVIVASAGRVNLAAGSKVTLDFDGDGLMRFAIDEAVLENAQALDDQVANAGTIAAEGGEVIMAASAAADVFDQAINNSGVVKAGRIENTGGQIRLVGLGPTASVLNTGTLDASARDAGSDGGAIDITGANVRQAGFVQADASEGAGGSVRLAASDTTTLTDDAHVSATGGQGGKVALLGERVGMFETAVVDVSGASGGGEALIGGDYQGKNPDVRNAQRTVIAEGATVRADATGEGDGGRVIVWADEATAFHGEISADGGPNGGDGGFVETSGKEYLDVRGRVSAASPLGNGGEWLLDPRDITITRIVTTGGDDSTGGDPAATPVTERFNITGVTDTFDSFADSAQADIDQIEASLKGGVDVTITTGGSGSQDGDITVDGVITVDMGAATLTLNAANDIMFNAGAEINGTGATLDVVLEFGQTTPGILDFGDAMITANALTLTGGAGVDTIIGPDAVNTWTSTGNSDGDLMSTNFPALTATFTGVENLTGGSADDAFNVNGGVGWTGALNGGAGDDAFRIAAGGSVATIDGGATGAGGDSIDFDTNNFGVAVTVTVTAESATDGLTGAVTGVVTNFSNVNDVAGDAGFANALVGDIGTGGTFDVASGVYTSMAGPETLDFTNFTDFTGGAGEDTFTFADAGTAYVVDGGSGGTDTLDISADAAGVFFIIDDPDSGSAGATSGTQLITFSNVGNLNGGTGNDTFEFRDDGAATNGSLSGTADGGGNTGDIIDWSMVTGALTITVTALTAPAATGDGFDGTATGLGATGFSGIESVIGNADASTSLQGADLTNTWTIDGGNDGNILADDGGNPTRTLMFTDFADLIGGGLDDTFQINGTGTIDSVAGGSGGTDTLVAGASNNIWNITSAGGGSVFDSDNTNFDVAQFSSISVLRGNSMDDAFRFSSGTSMTTVDGGATGAGGDILDFDFNNFDSAITVTLSAESATDGLSGSVGGVITGFSNINDVTGDIDFASTNILVGDIGTGGTFDVATGVYTSTAGAETLDFTNFTDFTGGAGEDTFTFADAGTTFVVDGGSGGTDTLNLAADSTGLTFDITTADGGSVGSIGFSNVGNLTAGSGDDSFRLGSSGTISGTLDGGALNATGDVLDFDTSDFAAPVTVTFSAESATDGLSGSVNGTDVVGFANINVVTGDTDESNSLIGDIGTGGTFDVGAGTYTSTAGSDTVAFSADFVSFTGGGGEDTFTFPDTATSFTVNGGSGGTDTLDLSADGTGLVFTIDGADDGNVGMIGFTDVGNLTSGAGSDTFNLDNDGGTTFGSLSGTITANGGATNAIDWSASSTAIGVTLSAESGTGFAGAATGTASVAGFTGIHGITGTGQTDTLTGTNSGGTFLIDDQGTSQDYTETNTLTFTNFEDLTGGSGVDTFNFQTDGSSTLGTVIHAGTIDGGDSGDAYVFTNDAELDGTITDTGGSGTDVIDVSMTLMDVNDNPDAGVIVSRINRKMDGSGETDSINFGGEPTSINSGAGQDDFAGIDDVDAPVLFADPGGSTFVITADGTVSRDGDPAETGILQVVGAADAVDIFIFDDIALLAGVGGVGIIGGDITLGTEFEDRIEIRNMSGNITTAQFDIDGIDTGSITIDGSTTEFVGVESLLGLDGIADLFNFTGSGFMRGQIDGRGGSDTADYSAVTNGTAFTIALDETITAALLTDMQSGVVSVETLTGHTTNPELFTIAGGSSFTLTAAQTDDGNVTGSGGAPTTAAFTDWGNLTGTSSTDSFTFNSGSSVSGAVNGLAGADTIDIDAIAGSVTITLTNSSVDNGTTTGGYDGTIPTLMPGGFSNVTVLVGTGNGDELVGDDVAATWTLDGGTETYATNVGGDPDFTFSNVADLTGGTAADTFDLDVDVAGNVAGGAGNDVFNINASLATATLQGGDDSDRFTLADGVSVTNIIDGGSGGSNVDELEGAATLATTFNLTADGDGNVAAGATASYMDIENLSGRGGADIFNVTASHTGDLAGGGANDDFNFDSNTLTGNVSGDGGDDTFDFNGGDVAGTLAGGGNTGAGDTLDFAGVAGPIVIDLGDFTTNVDVAVGSTDGFTGDAAGNDFTGIENYIGTGASDTLSGTVNADVFNVTANNGGTVIGSTATFAGFETLIGEGGNDQFNISDTFAVGDVQGGVGRDLLNMSNYSTDLDFTLSGANGTGSVAAPAMTFSGIEDFSSGSGIDTYTVNNGMAIDLGATNVASIDGGTMSDQITFASGADTTVAIDNIPNIEQISSIGANDTLIGQAAGETFQTIGLDSDDGTVGALTYTDFENLDGAGGNDTFRIDHNVTGSVQGGNGTDSFFIINTAAVSVGGGLDGGAGADTFQIGQNFSGVNMAPFDAQNNFADASVVLTAPTLAGGTGADVFDFREGSTLVGSVDGTDANSGGVTDTITIAFSTLAQEVLTAPGTVGGLSGTIMDFPALPVLPSLISGTFDNIVTITGNNLGTLVGANQINDWQITGVDSGTLNGSPFTNFSLLGGTDVDTFTFQSGGRITGGIRGGTDAAEDVVVAAVAGAHFHIDAAADGRIVLDPPLGGATFVTSFFDIDKLEGSAGGVETFFVDVAWAGALDGGAGGATVDFVNGPAASLGTQNLVLTGVGLAPIGVRGSATNVGSFDNITTIINAGPGSVTGPNFDTTFTINAGGTSTVAIDDTVNIGTVTINQLGNLIGGAAVDTFVVNTSYTGNLFGNAGDDNFVLVSGLVSGTADGGADSDTLDYTMGTYGALNVVITGAGGTDGFAGFESGAFSLSGFDDVNTILGRGGADNLTAPNAANVWTITGAAAFTLNGVMFNGFTNATGGSSTDAFTIADGGFTFGGTVNGAGGANSLTGRTTPNTWNLSSANGGSVNGVTAFSNVQTLLGGAGTDDFQVTDTVGAGYAAINGGGGVDTLNYSGYTVAPISVNLGSGAASFVASASAVEIITGTGMVDALTGPNSINTWEFDASGQGTLNGGSGGGGFDFNAIENLSGGSMADTFNVDVDHTGDLAGSSGADVFNISAVGTVLTGNISGGADADQVVFFDDAMVAMGTVDGGSGIDTLDWQNTTLTITFTSNGSGTIDGFRGDLPNAVTMLGDGFDNMNVFAGSGTGSTFTGSNFATVYTITGIDSFTVSENGGPATPFVGFGSIIAGTAIDQFIFSGGTLSGTIDGGNQATFENILTADSLAANSWTLGATGAGSVDPIPGGFININQLVGGAGVGDTFNFTNATATFTSIDGGTGAGVNDLNFSALAGPFSVNLETGTAPLVGTFQNINRFTGSGGQDTLIGSNATNTWTVTADDTGNVDGFAFSAVENLIGGNMSDQFIFTSAADQITGISGISGSGGDDTIATNFNGANWVVDSADEGATDGGSFTGIENLSGSTGTANLDLQSATLTGSFRAPTVAFSDANNSTGGGDLNVIGDLVSNLANQTLNTFGGAVNVSQNTGAGTGGLRNNGAGTFLIDTNGGNISAANGLLANAGTMTFDTSGGAPGTGDVTLDTVGGAGGDVNFITGSGATQVASVTSSALSVTSAGGNFTSLGALNVDSLAATTGGGNFANGAVTAATSASIDAGAGMINTGAVNAGSLSVVSSGGAALGAVTTTGDQTYTGPVTIGGNLSAADATFSAGGSDVNVSGSVNVDNLTATTAGGNFSTGAVNATAATAIDAGAGMINTGAVNAGSLSVVSSGGAALGAVTTTGNQTYTGPVTIGGNLSAADATFSAGGSDVNVSVSGSVNVDNLTATTAGGNFSSFSTGAVNATAATAIDAGGGNVTTGAINAASLNLTSGGATVGAVTTSGNQTYTGGAALAGALNGANVTVNGGGGDFSVSGAVNVDSLNVRTGGGNFSSGGITTAGITNIDAGAGSGTIGGAVTTSGNAFMASASGGLNFASTIAASTVTVSSGNASVGGVTTTGAQSYSGNVTLRGSGDASNPTVFNASSFSFGGLNVMNNVVLQPGTNTFTFNGAVTGTGNLDLVPTALTDIFIGNGTGPGNIAADRFAGFQGHLIIGALLNPLDSPAEDAVVVNPPGVTADRITVDQQFNVGGDVTLIGSNIDLNGGVGADMTTGQVTLVAVGDSQNNGGEGPGDITGPTAGTVSISGAKAVLIANSTVVNAGNIRLDLSGGDLLLAASASEDEPQFDPSSNATSVDFDPNDLAIIASLGLQLESVQVVFTNPASALTGLQNVQFIDVGLFEEELTLFGVIGNGIAMSLDQCEEAEGCAPNVSDEELDALIVQIEGRITEIKNRLAAGSIDAAQGAELLAGFERELANFQRYKTQLTDFAESQDGGGEDDFGELDDFAEEFDDALPEDEFAEPLGDEPAVAEPTPEPELEPIEEAFEELDDEVIEPLETESPDEFEELEEELDSDFEEPVIEEIPDEFENIEQEIDEFEELGQRIDEALILRLTQNVNVNEMRGAVGLAADGKVTWTGDIVLPSFARRY